MRGLLRFLLQVCLRVKVVGDLLTFENSKRLLIVSNHRSWLDALLIALCLPRHPMVIVPPQEANGPLMRWMLRCVSHETLDVRDPAAIKRIVKLLGSGRAVAMFPEGKITRSGAVMKVYPAAALAALRSGATILPVSLERSSQAFGRAEWFHGVTIRVCSAARIDEATAASARRRRALATRQLTMIMQDAALHSRTYRPIFECFLDACAAYGRKTALIGDQNEETHTYGDVLRMSLALARIMRRHTREKECVGVLLPNVAITVGVVLGLSAAGRVPAIFNYTGGRRALEVARTAAGVRTVITSRKFLEQARLRPLLEALAGCTVIYIEDVRNAFGLLDKLWLAVFALRFPRRAIATQSVDDPAVILFTSGSEGQPKGVALSHHAIVSNVAQMSVVIEFTPKDKILNPLPLYHAYSFTAGMILPLVTGTQLHLYISPLHYRAIPEVAYRSGCTVLFGTSTFLSYYAAYASQMDFCRLRYVISGGEKLAPEVARVWLEKFGLRIFEGYGCTECSPVISLATPSACRSGAVGRFLPDIDYRIEPLDGIEKGGVLHIRGPNLMLGYYLHDRPGELQSPRSGAGEGWYNTGDVVEVDEDGFVTIHGRVRRFAKVAGEMVSLDQIEQVARAASPAHNHAALLTMQDVGGESTVLFTTDPGLDRTMLQRAARDLGSRELTVARRVVHVQELPLLGSGKTDYVRLKSLAQIGAAARMHHSLNS